MTRRAVIALWVAATLVAVLVVAVVLANRYRNAIALEIANSALAGTGITVRDAAIDTLGTDVVSFREIVLELDDGTVLRIEGITLPAKFRGFAGSTIRIGTVTLLPGDRDAEPTPFATTLQRWLEAPMALPGATVTVAELALPGLPPIRELTWRADPSWAELDAVIEPYAVYVASGPGVDSGYRAVLRLGREDGEALSAELRIGLSGGGPADLGGELDFSLAALRPLLDAVGALPGGIVDLDASLRGTISASVPAQASEPVTAALELQLKDGLEASYRAAPGQPLTQIAVSKAGPVEARFDYPASRWTAATERAELRVSDGRFGAVPVTLDTVACESGLRCRFGLVTGLDKPSAGGFSAAQVSIDARAVEFTAGDAAWHAHTGDLRITPDSLLWNNVRLVTPTLRGRLDLTGDSASAALRMTTPDEGLRASLTLRHSFVEGSGELRIDDGLLSFETLPPSRLLRPWPQPWDLTAGSVGFSGAVRFRLEGAPAYRAAMALRVDRVAGRYDDIAFVGLTTATDLSLDADTRPAVTPMAVELDLIDIGFALENLHATVAPDLAVPAADVTGLAMSTLGGTVKAEPFHFDPGAAGGNRVVLGLESIQLPLIVGLADLEAVEVTGSVSGTLPVTIAGTRIRIDGGRLVNDAPGGVIRYRAGSPAGEGQLGIVTRTLRNFEYEALSSEVNYTEDGDLKLAMRLTGVNPDVDATQPVILNLGVEDNIPQLLRSLQAARSIEDILEKRYSR